MTSRSDRIRHQPDADIAGSARRIGIWRRVGTVIPAGAVGWVAGRCCDRGLAGLGGIDTGVAAMPGSAGATVLAVPAPSIRPVGGTMGAWSAG